MLYSVHMFKPTGVSVTVYPINYHHYCSLNSFHLKPKVDYYTVLSTLMMNHAPPFNCSMHFLSIIAYLEYYVSVLKESSEGKIRIRGEEKSILGPKAGERYKYFPNLWSMAKIGRIFKIWLNTFILNNGKLILWRFFISWQLKWNVFLSSEKWMISWYINNVQV